HPFNFASYEVVPWTNPPDYDINGLDITGPANPLGGPSFGDARWLRDTEPQRADIIDYVNQGIPDWDSVGGWVDGTPETFSHWQHLTNLSRSGNAWRIVKDISDVTGVGTSSPIAVNLDVPLEQWPSVRPTRGGSLGVNSTTGFPATLNGGAYNFALWEDWMTYTGWAAAQNNTDLIPHNFLNLSDLNGDGYQNDPLFGERPLDAFITGTNRWNIERWITDTDGDGMTDAFWHLYPQTLAMDTKQVIAISVTDNSARGNMNVATSFQRADYYGTDTVRDRHGEATKGHTPADLAIVGQNDFSSGNMYQWRVGFMDNLANLPDNNLFPQNSWISHAQIGGGSTVDVDWDEEQWAIKPNASILDELGIEVDGSYPNSIFVDTTNVLNPTDDLYSRYGRLWYWQLAGRDPFAATNGLRPFTLSDELELRVAEGNNYQFVGSRFERSINQTAGTSGTQFLRSSYTTSHEASEYRDQLDNRQLLYDNRRKLTMFNGSRNDLLPPWLRWEDRFWHRHDPESLNVPYGYAAFDISEYEANGIPDAMRPGVFGSTFPLRVAIEGINAAIANGQSGLEDAILNWREQSRTKLDLREYYADSFFGTRWWESTTDGRLTFAERLPLQLLLAMTDSQEHGGSNVGSSFQNANGPLGTYSVPDPDGGWDSIDTNYYQQARLASAGLASNILTYRDEDDAWRQHSTLPFTYNSTEWMANLPLSQAVTPPIIGRQSNDASDPVWGTYVPFTDANVAGPNESAVEMLGLEAQPFITEVFLAHAHQARGPGEEGACCLGSEVCVEVSQSTCEALLNGHWDPSDCDSYVCPGGACCLPEGGCVFIEQDECDLRGGEFRGEGASCMNAQCAGACCVIGVDQAGNGECIDVSAQSCAELGAAFAGFDTECASTTCTPLGSCCFESATCIDVLSSTQCQAIGGTFNLGELCATKPCKPGACCLPDQYGACVEVSSDTCSNELGGVYLGVDSVCDTEPCAPIGACCFGSGSCVEAMSAGACASDGGIFVGGAACADGALITSVYVPTADAGLLETFPTIPQGASVIFTVGEEAAGGRDHFIVDYLIGDEMQAGDIENAIVVLDYELFNGVQSTVKVARLDQDWDHLAATWNTYDGINAWPGGAGGGGDADETLGVKTITVGTPGDVKIHVEDFVQDAIVNRDRILSLIFYKDSADGEESNTQFASSETLDGTAPLLTVQYIIGESPCAAACCFNTEACEEFSLDTCNTLGGTYIWGVTCEEGACTGACCFSTGGCETLSEESCEELGDTFFLGAGTSCDISSCGIEGACCLGTTPDEIWLNEIRYDQFDTAWVNEFQYDTVDTAWVNEFHYDTLLFPWVNEFQYDTVESAWVNEFHYDNMGVDVNEFIEIALDSYITPDEVTVLLYDGFDGTVYDTLPLNTFAVGEVQAGKTMYSLVLPVDGLQNDIEGIAIVINGAVEQFISYEGVFLATDGSANGLLSVDYGISEEPAAAAGDSIGLDGNGSNFADFNPLAFAVDSIGLVNVGQVIAENELLEIALDNEINPATISVVVHLYDGSDGTVYNTLNANAFAVGTTYGDSTLYSTITTLQDGIDGIAITVDGDLMQFISYEGAFVATNGPATGVISENIVVSQEDGASTESLGLVGIGGQYSEFTWDGPLVITAGLENIGQTIEDVTPWINEFQYDSVDAWVNEFQYDTVDSTWVNEFHYDNIGVDVNEFIEIALDSYITPDEVTVLLYDG
ncbi:MAG: DNRLRE domain-containing protein, partial [Phycisphaerae bacterium]|nr:DNRLRE domain-containing protein [Phycisphaerae bacterium]